MPGQNRSDQKPAIFLFVGAGFLSIALLVEVWLVRTGALRMPGYLWGVGGLAAAVLLTFYLGLSYRKETKEVEVEEEPLLRGEVAEEGKSSEAGFTAFWVSVGVYGLYFAYEMVTTALARKAFSPFIPALVPLIISLLAYAFLEYYYGRKA